MSAIHRIHARRSTLLLTVCIFGHVVSVYPFWLFDQFSKWFELKHRGHTRGYLHLGLFGINYNAYEPDMPVGNWADKTRASIKLQIEALEYGFDQTSEEWDDLDYEEQALIDDTTNWKDGWSNNAPSKEWAGLVE